MLKGTGYRDWMLIMCLLSVEVTTSGSFQIICKYRLTVKRAILCITMRNNTNQITDINALQFIHNVKVNIDLYSASS